MFEVKIMINSIFVELEFQADYSTTLN